MRISDWSSDVCSSDLANGSIEVNCDLIQLGDVSSHAEASDAGRYANADIRLSAGYYATLVDFAATDGGDTSAASSIGSIDAVAMAAADSDSGASANIALYNNQSESIVFLNGPIHGVASGGYINGTLSLYGNFAGDSFSASMPEAIDQIGRAHV